MAKGELEKVFCDNPRHPTDNSWPDGGSVMTVPSLIPLRTFGGLLMLAPGGHEHQIHSICWGSKSSPPSPTQPCQVRDIDITAWATKPTNIPQSLMGKLLETDEVISGLVYHVTAAHVLCLLEAPGGFIMEASIEKQAECCASLRAQVRAAIDKFEVLSPELAEKPLQQPMALLRAWLKCVAELSEQIAAHLLDRAAQRLALHSARVDGLSPRWGDTINDEVVRDDGAKVQFLMNEKLGPCRRSVGSSMQRWLGFPRLRRR